MFSSSDLSKRGSDDAETSSDNCMSRCWQGGEETHHPSLTSNGIRQRFKPDETDTFLANELNQLSLNDRNLLFEEIHGIPQALNEDPKTLAEQFDAMEQEISTIREKKAYDRALFLSPKYVKDKSFRLLFLRAELLDGRKAARKMINYFQFKLELFGIEKLAKDIEIDDLDEDDKAALMNGHTHFLSHKDSAGRAIEFSSLDHFGYKSIENELRSLWFLKNKALRDDDAVSRMGVVGCFFGMTHTPETRRKSLEVTVSASRLLEVTPMRYVSMHFSHNSPLMRSVMGIGARMVSKYTRVRMQPHCGGLIENFYELQRYGIPRQIIPLGDDGELILDDFYASIKNSRPEQSLMPSSRNSLQSIPYPRQSDVLIGRGVPFQDFFGNVQLMRSVNLYKLEYTTTSIIGRKSAICKEIVTLTNEKGGRFLRRTNAGEGDEWEEASLKEAVEKVGHLLRRRPKSPLKLDQESVNVRPNYWDYYRHGAARSPPGRDGSGGGTITPKTKRQRT